MTNPPQPLLSVDCLSVRFSHTDILREVSFSLSGGEFLAIIGPNGAGKTTLIKTILGFNPDYTGHVALAGKPLAQYTSREKARRVAYVPQTHELGEFHRVREFILMGRYPYLSALRPPEAEDHAVVEASLKQTDTLHLADRLVDTLSGGERQKVMIAAALAQQPEILILDEPATFLDPKNQMEVQRLLRQINRDLGTTIIAITHDLNSVLHDASRVIGLKQGQVLLDGPPGQYLTPTTLLQLFDAPFLMLSSPDGQGKQWLVPDLTGHGEVKTP